MRVCLFYLTKKLNEKLLKVKNTKNPNFLVQEEKITNKIESKDNKENKDEINENNAEQHIVCDHRSINCQRDDLD